MDEIVRKLSNVDNIVVSEFVPFNHAEGYDVLRSLYYKDGGKLNKRTMAVSEEPILPMSEWIMKAPQVKIQSTEEAWHLNVRREIFRSKGFSAILQSSCTLLTGSLRAVPRALD